jgi:hypothetical protein
LRYGNAALLAQPNELDAVIARNFAESMELQAALFADGQASGVFRSGDVMVLAHLFSGLISAYQSVDPSVMSDDLHAEESMSLADLHQMVGRAFAK